MKGATTEPCASSNNPPNTTMTIMMGSSQSFFRARKKTNNSFKNDIVASKLVFKRLRIRSRRTSVNPVGV